MKKNLAIICAAVILAASTFSGCSTETQTVRVETVELEPETLEKSEADISNSAEAPASQEPVVATEAAVMSGSIPVVYEDQAVTVQTCTVAVTGTFHYAEAYEVLELVNEHRESLGLDVLTWNEDLRPAAEIRAAEATISWSHTRPNGESWYTVSDLVKGENLAKGYDSADAVFDAWMDSPGHRENIEWEQAATIYISCFEIASGSYWAMELGY